MTYFKFNRAPEKVSWSIVFTLLFVAYSTAVHAQISTDVARTPRLTIERYQEDWSYLAEQINRTGHWTEPFKYMPLNKEGSVYLTTGLEARSRYEDYRNVWAPASDDNYVWHRLMPYADLHAGRTRVFVQPILSTTSGLDQPERPIDTTGIDTLQAFFEVEALTISDASLRISAGRKLMAFGSGRIIDHRYGLGIPLPFDTIQSTLLTNHWQINAFYARPVNTMPGDFNDRGSHEKNVWGVYTTRHDPSSGVSGIDLYYLGLTDRNAVFDQGAGELEVHMLGARFFGDKGAWFWNLEGGIQRGRFASGDMAAWGMGGETGYRFLPVQMRPEVTIGVDIISGDENPDDETLGTFHSFFPRGKYFGGLSPVGPRNLVHVRSSVAIHPHHDVTVSLVGAAFWRESTHDGIYSIPGNLVRKGSDSDARFIGTQVELALAWQATREVNLATSFGAFKAGTYIKETGPSQTVTMASASVNFRF